MNVLRVLELQPVESADKRTTADRRTPTTSDSAITSRCWPAAQDLRLAHGLVARVFKRLETSPEAAHLIRVVQDEHHRRPRLTMAVTNPCVGSAASSIRRA